jgi:hypothetical protein
MQDPYLRLDMTIIGMTIVDAKQALQYSLPGSHPMKSLTTKQFTGPIVNDILNKMCISLG